MSIVFGGITPHGFSIIEEISGHENELFKPIRNGMKEFGRRFNQQNIDTIILLTPHGLRVTDHTAIYTNEACKDTLSQFGKNVNLEYLCQKDMAQKIYKEAKKAKISVVGVNYGAMSGELSNLPMNWGKKQFKNICSNLTKSV